MGLLADILKGISKPGRDLAELSRLVSSVRQADPEINRNVRSLDDRTQAIRDLQEYEPFFQSKTEQLGTFLKPVETTLRNAATVGSLVAPVGVAGNVASRAGAGALGAGLSSYGMTPIEEDVDPMKVLGSTLLGGGVGAAVGGLEKGFMNRANKIPGASGAVNVDSVEEISKLPNKTRKGLLKQAKSAGTWTPEMSESANIQYFLKNRGLAGNTPAETLEKMTLAYDDALKLKQQGAKEIGGLSRDYLNQAEQKFRESIANRGMTLTEENSKVFDTILDTFQKGPQDASALDKIAQRWYESGLTAAGEQKMSLKGLYSEAAKALRDVLRSTPASSNYDEGLKVLSRILGIEDTGLVAKSAKSAANQGIDIPLFGKNVFSGADVKTTALTDAASKARAGIGRLQESGVGPLANFAPEVTGRLGDATVYGTRLAQALGQEEPMQQGQVQPQYQEELPGGVTNEEFDALKYYLAESVFQGDITMEEADGIMQLLGMGGMGGEETAGPTTEGQRDYELAAEALQDAYQYIDQGAGKLPTLSGNVAGFFGSATDSSEYKNKLSTATAFLRKALIGTGQSEAELKNLDLPKPTDEPELAKQKIEALIPLLRARAGLQDY